MWITIQEKLMKHWGWVKKETLHIKKRVLKNGFKTGERLTPLLQRGVFSTIQKKFWHINIELKSKLDQIMILKECNEIFFFVKYKKLLDY